MKTLSLLRHSKTESAAGMMRDHARQLTPRGQQDAAAVGSHIMASGLVPQVVLCSSAMRTTQTWHILQQQCDRTVPVQYLDSLYLAEPEELLQQLGNMLPDESDHAMLIGHNPGIYQLCLMLAGEGDAEAIRQIEAGFPTSALAVIQCRIAQWDEIAPSCGALKHFFRPEKSDDIS